MPNAKVEQFRNFHRQRDIFLLPNAWDVASAMVYAVAGFSAIGTTSWGIAASMGYRDGEVMSFDEMLTVVDRIICSTEKPVTVDLEAGYGKDANEIAQHALKVARIGAVGINLEDREKIGPSPLRDMDFQCEVIHTIKERLKLEELDLFINARIDTYMSKAYPADAVVSETVRRGRAYIDAGADGVFVPKISDPIDIRKVCNDIPAPVNVLALPNLTDGRLLKELGVARLSVGHVPFIAMASRLSQDAKTFFMDRDAKVFFSIDHMTLLLRS